MVRLHRPHALSPSLSIQDYPLGLYRPTRVGYRRQCRLLRQIAGMSTITPIEKLTSPLGRQVIELQQLDHDGGGMSLLRTRIREGSRFTVFEIDPQTARLWGEALVRWAQAQPEPIPPEQCPE